MNNLFTRRATLSDTLALGSCIDAAYSRYFDQGIQLPSVSEGIAEDIADNIAWVAEQNEWIIGGLILVVNSDYAQSHTAKLANIVVHPSAGAKGIGRALIVTCEMHALKLGLGISLTTQTNMPEIVKLYEHLGWHVTGHEGDKVYMSKLLR